MKNSKLFSIGKSDAIKAFWMFLISTIISVVGDAIMQELNNGVYSLASIHWKEIGLTILVAVIAYLKARFLSNSNGDFLKKDDLTLDKK